MESIKGLTGLLKSRKAVGVYIIIGVLTWLLVTGKLSEDTYAMMVGGLKAIWLGAHSHEESNKAKAQFEQAEKIADTVVEVKEKLDDSGPHPAEPDGEEEEG